MTPNSMTRLGSTLRAGVTRTILSGVKVNGSINAQQMQSRPVAGAVRQKLDTIDTGDIFRCQVNFCDDASVCGP